MRRITVLFLAAGLGLAAGCACLTPEAASSASPALRPDAPPPGFVKRVLPNGLVILCLENHAAPLAVVQSFVRAGSMFEEEYLGAGISHFCEHLVAGGSTTTRDEKEMEKTLDSLGGANNAFTSTDRTAYFIRTTAGRNFETACELLADWMQHAAFKQKEVDREYKVIQREIEKGDVEPNRVLWKLATRTTFSFHPVRHPVIGYKELFRRLTRDDLVKYYRRMYTPDNMVVVAVGDFDAAKTADRLAALFRNARRSGRLVRVPPEDPPQQGLRRATVEMNVRSAYVMMTFRTVPLSHPDLYPLDVMSFVLSRGRSSRLVQRLREKEQLVESVTTWSYTPWYGAGRFVVKMVLKPENVARAEAAVLDEIRRLRTEGVTDAELARAKKQKIAEDVFATQTIEDQAAELGGNYLATGNPFFGRLYLAGIRKVQAGEIQAVARKYFSTDNLTVAVVRPRARAAARKATVQAPASKIQRFVLPNGLRVLVKRNPAVPVVSIQAYFLGGVLWEDERTAGTSRALGRMLPRGTRTRTALDIARAFDDMAGRIEGGSGNHTVFLRSEVLSEDFARALELFADCLLHPTFPDDELAKVKQLTLQALARRNDDWYRQAHDLLRRTLYRVSPYRLDPLGTPGSVRSLTRARLAACHARTVTARNGVLAIFGDVDVEQARHLAAKWFADLPPGRRAAPAVPADPPLRRNVVVRKAAGKPGTAVVYAAYPACSMADLDDRYALLVLDGVMSGIGWPGGWLHDELRGKGLVYLVHAYTFLGYRSPGYFGMYALTQPDKVDEVIGVLDRSAKRAASGLVPRDEFERAKQMAVTVELLGRQTNASLAMTAALDELYGLGFDFSEGFPRRVRAVTRADVLRVAKKYLSRRVLVVVTPKGK